MKKKTLRNLGLAVVAIAAFLVPSAIASASGGIVADKYSTGLEADPEGETLVTLGSAGAEYCLLNNFRGEIKKPSTTFGFGREGTGSCSAGGIGGPFKMNNCEFTFDPGTATMGIGPVGCGAIEFPFAGCQVEVKPQSGLSTASTSNIAEGDVEVSVEAFKMTYTVVKANGFCGGAGTRSDMILRENFHVTGYQGEMWEFGAPVDLSVITNGSLPVGAFTSGSNYEAQVYPASYRATPVPSSKISLVIGSAGTVQCSEIGASKIEAAASTLKFNEFNGCTFGGNLATVVPNSCSYEFTTLVGVSCTKEGDKIQIVTSLCTITLGAQPFTGSGFTLKNAGEGYDATVGLNSSSTSKSITTGKEKTKESQTGCLLFPTGKIGTFSANVNLSGTYAG